MDWGLQSQEMSGVWRYVGEREKLLLLFSPS